MRTSWILYSLSFSFVCASLSSHAAEPEPAKPAGGAAVKLLDAVSGGARQKRTEADLRAIESALQMYKINNGAFPTDAQGLKALVEKPEPAPKQWTKIMERVPVDAWDREYRLFTRTKDGKIERVIGSKGPDEKSDKDDIERVIQSDPAPASE